VPAIREEVHASGGCVTVASARPLAAAVRRWLHLVRRQQGAESVAAGSEDNIRPKRKAARKPAPSSLFTTLFHSNGYYPPWVCGSILTRVNESPNIYIIDDFLTESKLLHLHSLIADQDAMGQKRKGNFKSSYTDTGTEQLVNKDRTLRFIFMGKAQDPVASAIEGRAAEMIGALQDSVDPIQIVTYTDGQGFGLHHEAGTLDTATRMMEIVNPRRIATFFVYLNTLPWGIAHTAFPFIQQASKGHFSVQPKAVVPFLGVFSFCQL
jgi:hypothetical protein